MPITAGEGRAALAAFALAAAPATAEEVLRHPAPDTAFLVSRAVELPPGATVVHLGAIPPAPPPASASGVSAGYGPTQAQTVSALGEIDAALAGLGLSIADVFRLRVYLVAPEEAEGMDFEGFLAGYRQIFGTDAAPDLPVRTVVEVAALAHPEWLVEIEASALRRSEGH